MTVRMLAALCGALVGLACGGEGGGVTEPPPAARVCASGSGSTQVTVGNNFFDPRDVSVPVNSTVTWTWNSGGIGHNVTFTGGPQPLPTPSCTQGSGTHSVTFATTGRYDYTCTIHGGMDGSVTVTP